MRTVEEICSELSGRLLEECYPWGVGVEKCVNNGPTERNFVKQFPAINPDMAGMLKCMCKKSKGKF